MPDELKREERTIFVKLYSTSIDGVDANKLRIGDLDKFIGRKMETVEATGTEICLVFDPSTPDTGEKKCEDCGKVKDDVVQCQNPLEDVEEDLMWLCGECHDSRNEEV